MQAIGEASCTSSVTSDEKQRPSSARDDIDSPQTWAPLTGRSRQYRRCGSPALATRQNRLVHEGRRLIREAAAPDTQKAHLDSPTPSSSSRQGSATSLASGRAVVDERWAQAVDSHDGQPSDDGDASRRAQADSIGHVIAQARRWSMDGRTTDAMAEDAAAHLQGSIDAAAPMVIAHRYAAGRAMALLQAATGQGESGATSTVVAANVALQAAAAAKRAAEKQRRRPTASSMVPTPPQPTEVSSFTAAPKSQSEKTVCPNPILSGFLQLDGGHQNQGLEASTDRSSQSSSREARGPPSCLDEAEVEGANVSSPPVPPSAALSETPRMPDPPLNTSEVLSTLSSNGRNGPSATSEKSMPDPPLNTSEVLSTLSPNGRNGPSATSEKSQGRRADTQSEQRISPTRHSPSGPNPAPAEAVCVEGKRSQKTSRAVAQTFPAAIVTVHEPFWQHAPNIGIRALSSSWSTKAEETPQPQAPSRPPQFLRTSQKKDAQRRNYSGRLDPTQATRPGRKAAASFSPQPSALQSLAESAKVPPQTSPRSSTAASSSDCNSLQVKEPEVKQQDAGLSGSEALQRVDRFGEVKRRGRSETPPRHPKRGTWRVSGHIAPEPVIRRRSRAASKEKYLAMPLSIHEEDPRHGHLSDTMEMTDGPEFLIKQHLQGAQRYPRLYS